MPKSDGGSNPGERRGGRKKGVPNKITADIKALAQKYLPAAVKELGRLSVSAQNEMARIAAIKELFDRGCGKAVQPVSGDRTSAPVQVELIKRIIVDPDGTED